MMKIALWQAHSTPRDIDDNIQRLRETAKRAKAGGAQLLVTPEMFLTGYAIEEGFVDLAKSDPLALAARVAGEVGIGIVAGGPELVDGKVYNSTVFADETGTELTRYRKVQLFGLMDREYFEPSQEKSTVVDFHGVKVGMLICYDVEFPERVREVAEAGADLIAVPTAQMQPFTFVSHHLIAVRAFENHVHVAYANHHGSDDKNIYVGLSTVANPLGKTIVMGPLDREDLLFADIDPEIHGKATEANNYLADKVTR